MLDVPDVRSARPRFLPFLSNLYSLWQLPVFAAGTFTVSDLGERGLKGVPGSWRLLQVVA